MLQSSTLGVVLVLMSLKKSGIELELLEDLPVTPVEVGEALHDEQVLGVDYLQPHQARERRMICTMGNLPWFIINSLKETDWLRSLKNKLLANFPVTVLSTLCFECCRHGMHAICSWYVVVLFRSSVLQRMEQIERSIRFIGRGGIAPRLRFRRVVSTRRARGSLIIIIIQAFQCYQC